MTELLGTGWAAAHSLASEAAGRLLKANKGRWFL